MIFKKKKKTKSTNLCSQKLFSTLLAVLKIENVSVLTKTMKSVKNFFIERLQSIDNSEQQNANALSCKTKQKSSCRSTDGNSTTSGNSVSGEESPSNLSLTTQTPSNEGENICMYSTTTTTPTNVASPGDFSAENSISNPFDFSQSTTATNQKQKNRRKISLPWGRQSSIAKNLGLTRQHTIDTPSSFRIFRQSSNKLKVSDFMWN